MIWIACAFFLSLPTLAPAQRMDNGKIEKILNKAEIQFEGEPGSWMAYFDDYILLVVTDEASNRMRIFTPITEEEEVSKIEMARMLRANFHSALDAKYSIYEGFVVSLFTHPLKELTEEQFLDAIAQVANLAKTFGTTYSSTELIFGGEKEEDKGEEDKPLQKRS